MNRTNGFVTTISAVVHACNNRAVELKVNTAVFRAEYLPRNEKTDEDIVWHILGKRGAGGQYFECTLRGGIFPHQLDDIKNILSNAEMTLFLEFEPFFAEFRTLLRWVNTLEMTIKALADSAVIKRKPGRGL